MKILLLLLTLSSFLNAQKMSEEVTQAILTLESSEIEKQRLIATKTIVDSSNQQAWQKLINFFNQREELLILSDDNQGGNGFTADCANNRENVLNFTKNRVTLLKQN